MNVYTYSTLGGKDLIREFLDSLPKRESAEGYFILQELESEGVNFFEELKYSSVGTKTMGNKVSET